MDFLWVPEPGTSRCLGTTYGYKCAHHPQFICTCSVGLIYRYEPLTCLRSVFQGENESLYAVNVCTSEGVLLLGLVR